MISGMLKSVVFVIVFILSLGSVSAQQLIWQEDFESGQGNWDLNSTDLGGVAGGKNFWVLNSIYNGAPPFVPNTPNQPGPTFPFNSTYLHVVSDTLYNHMTTQVRNGHYNNITGIQGERIFAGMNTDISTVGFTNVELSFWWLNVADNDTSGQVYYSIDQGVNWFPINTSLTGAGNWTKATYNSGTFPVFDNQAQLRFGFSFVDPGGGTNPGLSLDQIEVHGTPTSTPSGTFVADTTRICINDCVSFTYTPDATRPTASRYSWNFGSGANDTSNVQNPIFCYTSAGVFTVEVEVFNANGSNTITQTQYIEVFDCSTPPTAKFSARTMTICQGDTLSFNDQSTGLVTDWAWSFPGTDSLNSTVQNPKNIKFLEAGRNGSDTVYTVTLTIRGPGGGSFISKNVRVQACVEPRAIMKVSKDSLCPGDCITVSLDQDSVKKELVNRIYWAFHGIDIYTYWPDTVVYFPDSLSDPSDGLTDTLFTDYSHKVCYNQPGAYRITMVVENAYGKDSASIAGAVKVGDFPQVAARDSVIEVYRGFEVELDAVGTGDKYYWFYFDEDGQRGLDNIECWFCKETAALPEDSTVYYVLHQNEYECGAVDSVEVYVKQEFFVGVPDAFSPNNDGSNDELLVRGNGISTLDFRIYSKYGQLVYQSHDPDQVEGWDGTKEEKPLNPGVFVYYLYVTFADGSSKELKGDVSLIR